MKKNLVLGMRLALPDFQRNNEILPFNPELTKTWENSLKANNYDYEIIYVDKGINYYNLGCNKMLLFRDYLIEHKDEFDKIILSDCLDVVFLKEGLFEYMKNYTIYVGDEPSKVGIDWVYENSKSILVNEEIKHWLYDNRHLKLLNTGLIGGKVEVVLDIIEQVCDIIEYYCKGVDEGVDMLTLNYIVYNCKYFRVNGEPFNTIFKKYDYINTKCYVAHK